MALKVIGAGPPRTGTTSLQAALQRLLGEPCYHMLEARSREGHVDLWFRALEGDLSALDDVLAGYVATTDWPASLFWRELMEQNPDALVVLSHRGNADTWWKSANRTVWALMRRLGDDDPTGAFHARMRAKAGLGANWGDHAAMKEYYNALYEEVVATVPAERLVVWQPSDGWEPICAALGVPVPEQDFVHLNSAREFRELLGLNQSRPS